MENKLNLRSKNYALLANVLGTSVGTAEWTYWITDR